MEKHADSRTVPATEFKQRCLALLDQVATTHVPITVTKHGRPVAVVIPFASMPGKNLMGSVKLVAEDPEAYYSTGESWKAETE
ncbi:MAG: type II toxin-antitoxin system Phd/YefM family antitoxin [Actinomycetota bacterium]|nr:type II toxin-antitoxin system Phd/YefM family antitoxin [Actinomycetota bacterium]